jgi:hypothetical protein
MNRCKNFVKKIFNRPFHSFISTFSSIMTTNICIFNNKKIKVLNKTKTIKQEKNFFFIVVKNKISIEMKIIMCDK